MHVLLAHKTPGKQKISCMLSTKLDIKYQLIDETTLHNYMSVPAKHNGSLEKKGKIYPLMKQYLPFPHAHITH